MNLKQINEFRAAHGLAPIESDLRARERKMQLMRNRAEKAEKNRALKAARQSRSK